MRFKAKKVYGSYKKTTCPFCERMATQKNEQGLDVCSHHTKKILPEIKCTCGSYLEPRSGKFGPYFNCINCGNINYSKGMEIKSVTTKEKPVKEISALKKEAKPKEVTITTNDVEYF